MKNDTGTAGDGGTVHTSSASQIRKDKVIAEMVVMDAAIKGAVYELDDDGGVQMGLIKQWDRLQCAIAQAMSINPSDFGA